MTISDFLEDVSDAEESLEGTHEYLAQILEIQRTQLAAAGTTDIQNTVPFPAAHITVPGDYNKIGIPTGRLRVDLEEGEAYHDVVQGPLNVEFRSISDLLDSLNVSSLRMKSLGILIDQPADLEIEGETHHLTPGYTALGNLDFNHFVLDVDQPTDARFVASTRSQIQVDNQTPMLMQRELGEGTFIYSGEHLLDWKTSYYLQQDYFNTVGSEDSTENLITGGFDRVSVRIFVDDTSSNAVDVRIRGRLGTNSYQSYINDRVETIQPGNSSVIHLTQLPWADLQVSTIADGGGNYTLDGQGCELIGVMER